MSTGFGVSNAVGAIRRVLVRPPDASFAVSDPAAWNYAGRPDAVVARREHAALVDTLEQHGARVERYTDDLPGLADAVFVFDPVLMTGHGAVILRMGKPLREGEEPAISNRLQELGIPLVGELRGSARAEGGDLLRIDASTLAAGIGFRTNREAADQLRRLLAPQGIEVLAFDLPFAEGPAACLHLLSLVSLVDHDLAVVYPRLMPVGFWKLLAERFRLVEVPDEEFATMAPNVLALRPGVALMLEGNPVTRRRLETAGCAVHTYAGRELSLKAEGGPTCLTLPLERDTAR